MVGEHGGYSGIAKSLDEGDGVFGFYDNLFDMMFENEFLVDLDAQKFDYFGVLDRGGMNRGGCVRWVLGGGSSEELDEL